MSLFEDDRQRELALLNLSIAAWHALLNAHALGSPPQELASWAFEHAEAFLAEAERRIKGRLT